MQSSTPQSAHVSINAVAPFMLRLSFELQLPANLFAGKLETANLFAEKAAIIASKTELVSMRSLGVKGVGYWL